MKRIGVLTSGGDAPGMNAALRAVVRTAFENEMEIFGIRDGYKGLIEGDMEPLDLRSVSNIMQRGGTIIHTARSEEFITPEGREKALKSCDRNGIENLVIIGGDGSFNGARELHKLGMSCIGIPATIDNDIASTEFTIGYDTAMNTVLAMVDRIRDTTEAHKRCSVVEVMGRNAGYIALYSGIAVGAMAILIPEIEFDFQKDVIERMNRTISIGKRHFIIVVAEGVGDTQKMVRQIKEKTGIEARATILGHVQRGGSPTVFDRVIASNFGNYAVRLINNIGNNESYILGIKNGKVLHYEINDALNMTKDIDFEVYRMAHEISI